MAKTKRINIHRDDAHELAGWFHTADTSRVDFIVVFHRTVEILKQFFDHDENDILETLTREWAIDEANEEHEQEENK
jgi:Ethanolamine utilization protein EutJ (predicted chaperonin)